VILRKVVSMGIKGELGIGVGKGGGEIYLVPNSDIHHPTPRLRPSNTS
jgi:hypothetical protein